MRLYVKEDRWEDLSKKHVPFERNRETLHSTLCIVVSRTLCRGTQRKVERNGKPKSERVLAKS